jgi:hypothetical protein
VNSNIHTAEITARFLNSVSVSVEDKPFVLAVPKPRGGHRNAELERHVDARSARRSSIRTHISQIVE